MKYQLLTMCFGVVAISGCSGMNKNKDSSTSVFSGTYKCDGYIVKTEDGSITVDPFLQVIEHKNVNGIDFIVVRRSDSSKFKAYGTKPGDAEIMIVDGNWRHTSFESNGELIASKVMAKFSDEKKNAYSWKSENPAYTDNIGKKWKAFNYSGKVWIDPTSGDKMSTANFSDEVVTCKRQPLDAN